jgi:hypothetical protein
MSHFAKLDENNIVTFVTVGRQEDDGKESELCARTGERYVQTSYNTRGGVYWDSEQFVDSEGRERIRPVPGADQTKAFRKNFASIGGTYDEQRDAFIPPKPFES